jgi:hypothetical protein
VFPVKVEVCPIQTELLAGVMAFDNGAKFVICMVSALGRQLPAIVQATFVMPIGKLLMLDVGLFTCVTVAVDGAITFQVPVPLPALLAASMVVDVLHNCCAGPAFAVMALDETATTMVEGDELQPFAVAITV